MTVLDLDNDLSLCQKHLVDTNTKGLEIETFLTRFLLIHVSGEYDKEIKRIISDRAKKAGDAELTSFVEQTVEKIRNPKISDIRGLLKKFNKSCVDSFNQKVGEGTELESRYQNIIVNRNSSAHGDSINMTIEELISSHEKAKDVLKAMLEALNP